MKVVEPYNPRDFKDREVEYPDRYTETRLDNNRVILVRDEGEIDEPGTALNADNLNPAEIQIEKLTRQAILNYEKNNQQSMLLDMLTALIAGDLSGDVYSIDFNDIDMIKLERGVFDRGNNCLYYHNEDGERVELRGFALTIG